MFPLRCDAGDGEGACQPVVAEEVQGPGKAGCAGGQQQTNMLSKRKARDWDKQVGAYVLWLAPAGCGQSSTWF